MRHIRDNNPPEALIRCLAGRRQSGQSLDYDEVGQVEVNGEMVSVTHEIRKARIKDQGGICAYTMMRIDEDSCHNEHIIPSSVSRDNSRLEETLEYTNIVACFPKREETGGCEFGAAARGNKELAVTPMDAACEQRIRFDRASGRVESASLGDTAITELLDVVLVLNCDTLIARRLAAFRNAGVGLNSPKPLTESQARRLAADILQHRRGRNLAPFCIAIAHAALRHADLVERRKANHRRTNR